MLTPPGIQAASRDLPEPQTNTPPHAQRNEMETRLLPSRPRHWAGPEQGRAELDAYLQPAAGWDLSAFWSSLPPAPPRTRLTPGQRAWKLGIGLQDLDKTRPRVKSEHVHFWTHRHPCSPWQPFSLHGDSHFQSENKAPVLSAPAPRGEQQGLRGGCDGETAGREPKPDSVALLLP